MAGRILQAGPLSVCYQDADLRDIRLGSIEILRRVYMVFQDRNWTARPWIVNRADIDDRGDNFSVRVEAKGTFDATPMYWTARIEGTHEGVITYQITGGTHAPFLRNRLGLCVLHPVAECAGQPISIEHSDGTIETTRFPAALSPHQPFLDIRAMTHQVLPELFATVRFRGEVFETEDHRNWSDASFKTYCTPISLPFPVTVQPGDALDQQVSLRLEGATHAPIPPLGEPIITLAGPARHIPGLGLQIPRGAVEDLTPVQTQALSALQLNHLRVDIDCADAKATDHLNGAVRQARQLDVDLWIALYASTIDGVSTVLDHLPAGSVECVDRWLLFDPTAKVTPTSLMEAVRHELHARFDKVLLCSGTDLYFTELNRQPLDAAALALLDGICFSVNPQVHASDDQSVLQNTAGLGVIARDAPRLAGGLRIMVSPLTLRPRFNPNATAPELDVSNTPLPTSVDARQRTNFAAIWALLSIKEIAEAGTIDAVTIGETIGWRGVMADTTGSPDPQHFSCAPNEQFPIWRALHQLSGDAQILPTTSTRPDAVQAVVLQRPKECIALLMNLTDQAQQFRLEIPGAPASGTVPAHAIIAVDLTRGQ